MFALSVSPFTICNPRGDDDSMALRHELDSDCLVKRTGKVKIGAKPPVR
jgi:hypothetical protein